MTNRQKKKKLSNNSWC